MRTDFYPRNKDLIRTVTAVRPSRGASESGWTVSTSGLSADAGWFECVDCGARGRCACENKEPISGGTPPPA